MEQPPSDIVDVLRPAQLQEYRELFACIDGDGSGVVSMDELETWFGDMGVTHEDLKEKGVLGSELTSIRFNDFAMMLFRLNSGEVHGVAPTACSLTREDGAERVGAMSVTQRVRRWVWKTFDDPSFSLLAKAIAAWIMLLIAVSCVAFILESYRPLHKTGELAWNRMEARFSST